MLPGFGGHLISESFLERFLADRPATGVDERRADLVRWQRQMRSLGPASSLRGLFEHGAEPLIVAVGLARPTGVEIGTDFVLASLSAGSERLTLIVAHWGARLDPLWRPAVVEAGRQGAAWCLLFNGTHLRLICANRLHSRRYVEFNLEVALDEDRTLHALLTVVACASFETGSHRTRPLIDQLVAESDLHALDVSRSLRDGVLDASASILGALMSRPPRPLVDQAFEQALTIVYRMLFLLFAEARRLVPLWHPVYRDSYSLEALGASIERSGRSCGLWDALQAVSRLAHTGCRAGDLRVTPFNGRLFAPARTPLAERRNLDDEAARRALVALSTRPAADRAGRERIAYRDLGVEQLGAVYETLLDYSPCFENPARSGSHRAIGSNNLTESHDDRGHRNLGSGSSRIERDCVSLRPGSGVRKATGTFYTPQPLAQYLVRRTLAPLLRDTSPDRILELKVVDPAMGSGAFLVSACGYLSHAYEEALVSHGVCHSSDLGPAEHAAIRRTIAERCLFGVDLNPMAVQLARLSLWLATLAADRPLTFLDHHLQTGDSLLGAWVAALSRPPSKRPRTKNADGLPLLDADEVSHAVRHTLPVRFNLALEPNDTLDQVRKKERELAALNQPGSPLSIWKRIADLWCASWFETGDSIPASAFGSLSDLLLTGRGAVPPATAERLLQRSQAVARRRRFFHWELEFPEVFFDSSGQRLPAAGFDAVIGNPPWDMIRADTRSSTDDGAEARRDASSVVRFTRDSGVYTNQSDGHANRYQLFAERAVALTRPGGRIGLVLPSGIASDHGSAPLRRLLFSRCGVDALIGFDNRDAVFPIHRSVRFLLMTATSGIETSSIGCRLGERNPAVLETEGDSPETDSWFPVRVTPALLRRLSGDDLAVPDLRSPLDLTIAERSAAMFPPLGDRAGWAARFGRELNVTEDRRYFSAAGCGLPVVEGKHIEPFRVDLAAARWSVTIEQADRLLGERHRRPRVGYRDVASATNRLTLIAAVLPSGCVSTHTVFCLRTALPIRVQYFLCGLFNSFVVNYLVRLRVTTHVTTAIVERLPVPQWDDSSPCREIAELARALTRGPARAAAARLNALAASLYLLSPDEFAHVLETFPLVERDERDAALREFQAVGKRRDG